MGNSDLILNIQSIYNQFTKAEKKVADYIINNQKEVLYMSITDLADECRVGDLELVSIVFAAAWGSKDIRSLK